MPGRARLTCRRKGCERTRYARDTFCSACWSQLPGWIKAAMMRAKVTRDAAQLTQLTIKASDHLAGKAPAANACSATEAYSRTCAMLGEHDEIEAAE
ncbi:MAG: hypothetical protein EON59_01360 [Alphaproteobacteria bacterium]|nr:MAG: hypothetical protein EON59_01360 [Alphaproteobacteria bacterium]